MEVVDSWGDDTGDEADAQQDDERWYEQTARVVGLEGSRREQETATADPEALQDHLLLGMTCQKHGACVESPRQHCSPRVPQYNCPETR